MVDNLRAINPTGEYAQAFLEMCKEYAAWGETFYSRITTLEEARERIALERAWEAGKRLAADSVPSTAYWFLDEEECLVGTGRIRPQLNSRFKRKGGNLGFDVRPTLRHNGYGGYILSYLIGELRAAGLERALVTCQDSNLPSWHAIERNGGILERMDFDSSSQENIRRYWIHL